MNTLQVEVVQLFRARSGPYSVVVAAPGWLEARETATVWAKSVHGVDIGSLAWHVRRARSVPDNAVVVVGR